MKLRGVLQHPERTHCPTYKIIPVYLMSHKRTTTHDEFLLSHIHTAILLCKRALDTLYTLALYTFTYGITKMTGFCCYCCVPHKNCHIIEIRMRGRMQHSCFKLVHTVCHAK